MNQKGAIPLIIFAIVAGGLVLGATCIGTTCSGPTPTTPPTPTPCEQEALDFGLSPGTPQYNNYVAQCNIANGN